MRSMFVLFRWECRRVLSNWHQTLAIFLVPSAVLLLALYLFPVLVDYISTGNIGNAAIVLVSPDESMLSFVKTDSFAANFTYEVWNADTFSEAVRDGRAAETTNSGGIIVVFRSQDALPAGQADSAYRDAVDKYFDDLIKGTDSAVTGAYIDIYSDPDIIMSQTIAFQFQEDVLPRYKEHIVKTAGSEFYNAGGGAPFVIDVFNPYTRLMEYKSQANPAGARVIPGILILLLYYCVYSLASDILAADRERGFLSKLTLTPLSTRGLLWGKALSVIAISALTSVITLLILLLSSWTNRRNSALSLIPFGLQLTPVQLVLIMGSVICAAAVMTLFCFKIIFDIKAMQDITINLQLPLLLFLVDFFLQLFRISMPFMAEYLIPMHNNLLLIHDIMAGTGDMSRYAIVIGLDVLTVSLLFFSARRAFEQDAAPKKIRKRAARRPA